MIEPDKTISTIFIVSLSVTDDDGAVGNNEQGLTYITVLHGEVNEGSGVPHGILSVKASVVSPGASIDFSGAGSWAWEGTLGFGKRFFFFSER